MELNFYFKFFFFHFPIIPGSRIFDIDKLSRVSQIQYSDFVIVLGPEAHATTEGQVKTAPPPHKAYSLFLCFAYRSGARKADSRYH